jgi:hypothetical protein
MILGISSVTRFFSKRLLLSLSLHTYLGSSKSQAPSSKEAPKFKLQTKSENWSPSKAAR